MSAILEEQGYLLVEVKNLTFSNGSIEVYAALVIATLNNKTTAVSIAVLNTKIEETISSGVYSSSGLTSIQLGFGEFVLVLNMRSSVLKKITFNV